MKYAATENKIIIYSKDEFVPEHILECGQIFSYEKIENTYIVYSADKLAKITETGQTYEIETNNVEYFINFFDLNTDYAKLKLDLIKTYPYLKKAIDFGNGIRILKQDIFETIISFIISANNNIKRIKKILFAIRQKFGTKILSYYSFPTLEQLSKGTIDDFKSLGAGYRAKYLVEACKMLKNEDLTQYKQLSTKELNKKLLSIMGVGQKVSDCIMLFGFSRGDVFPVDTWIEKVYCSYFEDEHDRVKIRKNLLTTFGANSGYVQQYLFYSQRKNG
ncbi:MAG: 8-oxoguanine DNA glycosylase [Clostridiales bacterium]|nr:8-oxoguanine DNA glycosylase [Clostridiales bacterium]